MLCAAARHAALRERNKTSLKRAGGANARGGRRASVWSVRAGPNATCARALQVRVVPIPGGKRRIRRHGLRQALLLYKATTLSEEMKLERRVFYRLYIRAPTLLVGTLFIRSGTPKDQTHTHEIGRAHV